MLKCFIAYLILTVDTSLFIQKGYFSDTYHRFKSF